MKTLRTKFKCTSVTNSVPYGDKITQKVDLITVSSKPIPDNQFTELTPAGTLEMLISNQVAVDFIKPGRKYRIDITEEEEIPSSNLIDTDNLIIN